MHSAAPHHLHPAGSWLLCPLQTGNNSKRDVLQQGWVFPSGSEALKDYLENMHNLPSWKGTQYSDQDVISYYENAIQPAK